MQSIVVVVKLADGQDAEPIERDLILDLVRAEKPRAPSGLRRGRGVGVETHGAGKVADEGAILLQRPGHDFSRRRESESLEIDGGIELDAPAARYASSTERLVGGGLRG